MLKNFDCIVLLSDSGSRARLREVLQHVALHTRVHVVPSEPLAIDIVTSTESLDSVFISSDWDEERVCKFIEDVREKGKHLPKPPLIMMTVDSAHSDISFIAPFFTAGVHGFIGEPFCTEQIVEILERLASKPVNEVVDESKKPALLQFAVGQALKTVDFLADRLIVRPGKPDVMAMRQLRRVHQTLASLSSGRLDEYFEQLINKTINLEPPKPPQVDNRSRRRAVEEKIPVHPGVLIQQEMSRRRIANEHLLKSLKWTEADLDGLLQQKVALSEEQSRDIARVLGQTANYWLGLQQAYDTWQQRKHPNLAEEKTS